MTSEKKLENTALGSSSDSFLYPLIFRDNDVLFLMGRIKASPLHGSSSLISQEGQTVLLRV